MNEESNLSQPEPTSIEYWKTCWRYQANRLDVALDESSKLRAELAAETERGVQRIIANNHTMRERNEAETECRYLQTALAAARTETAKLRAELAAARECIQLKDEAMLAVLCDPEGTPCFEGSDGDRQVIADVLALTPESVAEERKSCSE